MSSIDQLPGWIASARIAVAFTGAGISTESGIPDFRSPGGIWSRSQPVYYDEFMRSPAARYEYWRQKSEAHRDFADSLPNVGHRALARLEQAGKLAAVVTQNIDGLHQMAGSRRVVELHGTARFIACQDCGERFGAAEMVERFLASDSVPECPKCESDRMKHATISFGQSLDETTLDAAIELAETCDLMIAIGSSLVVYPAAGIPELAKKRGARLVILNRDPTPLDPIADLVLRESIGDAMGRVEQLVFDQP